MIDLRNLTVEDVGGLTSEQLREAISLAKEGGKGRHYHHFSEVGRSLRSRLKSLDENQLESVPVRIQFDTAEPVDLPPAPEPTYVALSPQAFCEKVLVAMAAAGNRRSSVKLRYNDIRREYQTYRVMVEVLAETGGELPGFDKLGRDEDTGVPLKPELPKAPSLELDLSAPEPVHAPTNGMSDTDLINQLRRERAGSGGVQFEGADGFTPVEPVVLGNRG